jgi:hypothetical protein
MHPRKVLDLDFGSSNEDSILKQLRIFFDDPTIRKTKNVNDHFDFIGDNKLIELKSRRCSCTQYETTIIGTNKFKNIKPDIDYYCVFKFTDVILYIKYDRELFDEFEIKPVCRRDRGRIEKNSYYFVPINNLTPLII